MDEKYIFDKDSNDHIDVTVHGIPYAFDDRTGSISIWNLSLFLDGIEDYMEKRKSFFDYPLLKSGEVSFVYIKQVIKVYPDLYKYTHLSDVTLRVVMQLCYPGRTSICHVTRMTHRKSGCLLAERFIKLTRIDNENRRPVVNPDWYFDKYSHLKEHKIPIELLRTDIPKPPNGCFEHRSTVRYSDMDVNLHTHQLLYIKLSFDCATAASLSGRLRHFSGDIAIYPVQNIRIEYIGESFPEDEILVLMWQGDIDCSQLNFSVYKASDMKQLTFITCHLALNKFEDAKCIANL